MKVIKLKLVNKVSAMHDHMTPLRAARLKKSVFKETRHSEMPLDGRLVAIVRSTKNIYSSI